MSSRLQRASVSSRRAWRPRVPALVGTYNFEDVHTSVREMMDFAEQSISLTADTVAFFVCGFEYGEGNHHAHLQLYIRILTEKSPEKYEKKWKKVFGFVPGQSGHNFWLSTARGKDEDNFVYCSKGSSGIRNYCVFGSPSNVSSRRSDLVQVQRKIFAQGYQLSDLMLDEKTVETFIKYPTSLKQMQRNALTTREPPVVHVYTGVSGSGKSYRAHLLTGLAFRESQSFVCAVNVSGGPFWVPSSYNPDVHVIFLVEEIPQNFSVEILLHLCGESDVPLPQKYGEAHIRSKHIVLTSNVAVEEWLGQATADQRVAFQRRVAETIVFKHKLSDTPDFWDRYPSIRDSQMVPAACGAPQMDYGHGPLPDVIVPKPRFVLPAAEEADEESELKFFLNNKRVTLDNLEDLLEESQPLFVNPTECNEEAEAATSIIE